MWYNYLNSYSATPRLHVTPLLGLLLPLTFPLRYSHRSKPGKVGKDGKRGKARINSSRFACGTTSQEQALFPAAEPVLRARGVDIDPYFLQVRE